MAKIQEEKIRNEIANIILRVSAFATSEESGRAVDKILSLTKREIDREKLKKILYGYDCEYIPQLEEAITKIATSDIWKEKK